MDVHSHSSARAGAEADLNRSVTYTTNLYRSQGFVLVGYRMQYNNNNNNNNFIYLQTGEHLKNNTYNIRI